MAKTDDHEHNQTIIDQFSKQAVPFANKPRHLDLIETLVFMSSAASADEVLDVACGPGTVACAFAKSAKHVTGIDITPEMIKQAKLLQNETGLENITWHTGNVVPLPYPDEGFSIVLTRYSFHHFLEPRRVFEEMIRVCKPGGKVVVADVAVEPRNAEAYNSMEKLRDPSHVRALTKAELENLLKEAGLINISKGSYRVEVELEMQLNSSFPLPGDSDKLRKIFRDDIGRDSLGVGARMAGGEIHFSYPIIVLAGEKGA
jgi:ubiquinone/menaquinone biosynthesis C-methylase UbiE